MELDSGVDRDAARCNAGGSLHSLFFSDQLDEIAIARAICRTCSQIERCLQGAVERRETAGVWGGELFLNGAVLANKRPRGRPRKHPLPVAQPA